VSVIVDWIAVDWGTSNLRAWGIGADGAAGPVVQSDKGMGKLTREQFPAVLDEICSGMSRLDGAPVDVVICGMAGARQGWLEAPYLDAPTELGSLASGAVRPEGADKRLAPRILPGICQRTTGAEDVMRGEETQLLGLLALRPGFSGTVIMPGTHSKWASIDNGRLRRFSTAMTGELYDAIGTHSVLRHSLNGERMGPHTEDGVTAGLAAGLEAPERLTGLLFKTRAASLLAGHGPDWCSGYLSGLLVGAEIGGHKDWMSGQATIPLIGSERLGRLYTAALARIGIKGEFIDATEATLAGLKAVRHQEPA
jgi:2-dehydro-3-deoxygalactonokinase